MTKLVAPKTFDQEFNVRAFGATGDGTTEDYAAMQAAFNALNTNGGGTLIIPPGTYIISQTLTIGSAGNIHIKAHGATIKRSANPDGAGPTKMYGLLQNFRAQGQSGETSYNGYDGVKNILIEGGIWDVNGRAGGPTDPAKVRANGIMIAHSTNVIIRDITVLDVVAYHAIEINSTDGAVIENCTFSGFNRDTNDRVISAALQLDYPSIDTLSSKEYDLTFCKNVLATGITVKESADNGSYGRFIESHSSRAGHAHSNVRVIGNYVRNTMDYAMDMDCWRNVVISGNIIESCNGGIKVELPELDSPPSFAPNVEFDGKSPVQDVVISDNVLEDMGQLNGNPSTGVPLFVGGVYVLAAGAAVNARNIVISNNVVRKFSNPIAIAVDNSTQSKVIGNSISEGSASSATGRGIHITNGTYVNVSDNNINSIKETGILVTTSNQCDVKNNTIFDVGRHGIQFVGGAIDNSAVGNYIKGASRTTNITYSGIQAASSCVGTVITGNKVRKYGDAGNEVLFGIQITSSCSDSLVRLNDVADTGISNAGVTPSVTVAQPTLLLYRTTTQSIPDSTDTAVSWSSAQVNTGPASWWVSGNNIVLPWAGMYHVSAFVGWASNSAGARAIHLNRTTTIATSNFKMGVATTSGSGATEVGRVNKFSQVLYEATAGTTYVLAAFQSVGGATALNIDNMQSGQQARAWISLTYLGNA